jgi:hypothetical protein
MMKFKSLLVLIFIVSCCNWTQGQASTSQDFSFLIWLPKFNTHDSYRLFYLPRAGHEIERITAQRSPVDHTLIISGYSSYVVGVAFPLFLLEEDVYENGILAGKNYYQLQYSSQGVDGNNFPWVQLDPAYKSLLMKPLNMHNGKVTIDVSHCNRPECIDHFNSLAESDQLWQPISMEVVSDRIQLAPMEPERAEAYFIISKKEETYTAAMNVFSKKYGISFDFQECAPEPSCMSRARMHNQNLATQLNQQYGVDWKKELPVKVFGL